MVNGLLAVLDVQSHGVGLGPIADIADIVSYYHLVVIITETTDISVKIVVGRVLS